LHFVLAFSEDKAMTQTISKAAKAKWMVAVLLMAVADAAAQTQNAPAPRQIIVSIPDRKLALIEDGRVLKIYPVAVGAEVSPSPSGEFKVVNRLEKPTYYHPGKVIGAGASNPLGTRWIGLDRPHYGIHGTNVPSSIGKAASHGCIRMGKRDLEELFTMVRIGDTVVIRTEADEQTTEIFGNHTNTVLAQAQTAAAGGQ
jgi:lipoprotein-anchoring transpeptidase ErfK/SrfK